MAHSARVLAAFVLAAITLVNGQGTDVDCSVDFECTPRNWDPVCGSDGKTYPNECYLKLANCDTVSGDDIIVGGFITVVSQGACEVPHCSERGCLDYFEPVCGSDGKTYGNECYLEWANCDLVSGDKITVGGGNITVVSQGACETGGGATTRVASSISVLTATVVAVSLVTN